MKRRGLIQAYYYYHATCSTHDYLREYCGALFPREQRKGYRGVFKELDYSTISLTTTEQIQILLGVDQQIWSFYCA